MTDLPDDRAVDQPEMATEAPARTPAGFAGLDSRGWRTTIVAAVLMLGIVGGTNLVNAAVPLPDEPAGQAAPGPVIPGSDPAVDPGPLDPGPVAPGDPIDVGHGLTLRPSAGWTVIASEPGQVALQKGGVVLVALATPYDGEPASLAEQYAEAFFAGGQFQSSSPRPGTLGNDVPSVVIGWSGITEGTQLDGVIAAGVASGVGFVLNGIAPMGQLQAVADDLDAIGATLRLAPGGE
jgi:hypothetical protein